jgi:hypothetical protein
MEVPQNHTVTESWLKQLDTDTAELEAACRAYGEAQRAPIQVGELLIPTPEYLDNLDTHLLDVIDAADRILPPHDTLDREVNWTAVARLGFRKAGLKLGDTNIFRATGDQDKQRRAFGAMQRRRDQHS